MEIQCNDVITFTDQLGIKMCGIVKIEPHDNDSGFLLEIIIPVSHFGKQRGVFPDQITVIHNELGEIIRQLAEKIKNTPQTLPELTRGLIEQTSRWPKPDLISGTI